MNRVCLWVAIILLNIVPTLASNVFKDDIHSVELISGYDSTGGLSAISMGLKYEFKDHWKTYWKFPGTPGVYPIKIDFSNSQNVQNVILSWPRPDEFEVFKLKAYGYAESVVLPLTIVLKDPKQNAIVKLKLDYLVCDPGNCVQRKVELSLSLKVRDADGQLRPTLSRDFELIKTYLERVPRPDTGAGMTIDRIDISEDGEDKHVFTVHARNPKGFAKPVLFIDPHSKAYVDFAQVDLSSSKDQATFIMDVYANEQKKKAPTESMVGKSVTLVLEDGDKAIETNRIIMPETAGYQKILLVMLFAFIGGFILNFMPCVLPVIMIKVFSILQQHGVSPRQIRLNFLYTVAGIISSFLVIALLTIVFRQFGYAVGWGTQFQEPVFLVAVMLVIALFAYNMLGWFEILVSSSVATKLVEIETRESSLSYFLSGAFVTVLATPCTAPFLGTALSFALSRGPIEITTMFTVMGLGLSLPFLLLALFPGAIQHFPKPGMWMITFKKFLSVLLFGTLIWLLWTLNSTHGTIVIVCLSVIFAVMGILLYLKFNGKIRPRVAWLLVLFLSAAALSTPYVFETEYIEKDLSGTAWKKFDQKQIPILVKEGKVVFVDITADWCLTCKANEYFVLDTKEVQAEFSKENVVAMQGDWTNGDPILTAFLKSFNKFAVPCYVIFGPKIPDGKVLPEVLTTDIVLQAIKDAGG